MMPTTKTCGSERQEYKKEQLTTVHKLSTFIEYVVTKRKEKTRKTTHKRPPAELPVFKYVLKNNYKKDNL